MKAIKIILLLAATLPLAAKANSHDSSAWKSYRIAKQHLENMLAGIENPNFEEAIYQIENAWYGGRLQYATYKKALDYHTGNIIKLTNGFGDSAKLDAMTDLKGTREQKTARYKAAVTNYSIFQYMTTPTAWVEGGGIRQHDPYRYSSGDPMGTADWTNTQVTHLINEGAGNCFALASLFRIFSERLASGARLCTAPGHIYIRHADENGIHYNVELSSRTFPGTGTIETLTYTPDEATRNNISLRELDVTQSIALCLVYLAKGYQYRHGMTNDDFMLSCAETALKYDSLNLNAMLLKAEILERKLTRESREIKKLNTKENFYAYEQWIRHIFDLGYREIPFDMKNLLIKGWTKDTVMQLAGKDHNPQRKTKGNLQPVRYASLSWGLFDEEIRTKPLERYGNTVFDTRTKKIVAFMDGDILYNHYNFDPVVFAWNVDPLAHEFSWQSPYAAFDNSPIWKNDPTGKSGEVVIDQQSKVMTVNAKIILYGSAATKAMAKEAATNTMNAWNAAGGKVTYKGQEYAVRFNITAGYRDVSKTMDFLPGVPRVAGEIMMNTDIKNNYYRVENVDVESRTAQPVDQSFFFGSNSAFISSFQNERTGGTTIPHEFGHGMGISGAPHPIFDGTNIRIMNTESQLGMNASNRQATQADIDDLGLQDLNFQNGRADLGQTVNTYYTENPNKSYQITTK